MNRYISIITMFLICCLASGCKGEQVYPMQSLEIVYDGSTLVPSDGVTVNLEITTNTKWEIWSPTEDWVSVSEKSSTGNASVQITIDKNAMGERTTYIIVSTSDGEISRRVDITQMGYIEGRISISALLSFEKEGGYVFPNEPWKIFGFVSLEGAEDGYINVLDDAVKPKSSIMVKVSAAYNAGDMVLVGLSKSSLVRTDSGTLALHPESEPENLSLK